MATLSKMSLTNAQCGSSEGCMLLGEVGGMTRIERVKDKEMDEAGHEAEDGKKEKWESKERRSHLWCRRAESHRVVVKTQN